MAQLGSLAARKDWAALERLKAENPGQFDFMGNNDANNKERKLAKKAKQNKKKAQQTAQLQETKDRKVTGQRKESIIGGHTEEAQGKAKASAPSIRINHMEEAPKERTAEPKLTLYAVDLGGYGYMHVRMPEMRTNRPDLIWEWNEESGEWMRCKPRL